MVNQYCAYSFARNWQLHFLNQQKGENDHRKYFMISMKECCRPGEGWTCNLLITSGMHNRATKADWMRDKKPFLQYLIWVYTVCLGLSVGIIWVHMFLLVQCIPNFILKIRKQKSHIYPKYVESHAWANSVDPHQTAMSDISSALFRYITRFSIWTESSFWPSMVKYLSLACKVKIQQPTFWNIFLNFPRK